MQERKGKKSTEFICEACGLQVHLTEGSCGNVASLKLTSPQGRKSKSDLVDTNEVRDVARAIREAQKTGVVPGKCEPFGLANEILDKRHNQG
jgi:hypothetical protein